MQRRLCIFMLSALWVVLAGCAHMASPSRSYETVTIPGTGDSQDLLREIAKSYTARYPDRRVIIPDSIGSGGGFKVVGQGSAPIGRVARPPSAKERAVYGTYQHIEFARVPVAFVVDPQAGVRNLSEAQLCAIYSGRFTNWRDVGGNDMPIKVQARPEEGSNMKTVRRHIGCFADLTVTSKAHFNLRNANLVTSMQTFAGAIGFMPLSEAQLHGFSTVSVDGVQPDAPHFKLGIGLSLVYKQPLSESIQAFVDYLSTESAQTIMRQTGHLPTPRAQQALKTVW